MEEYVMLGLGLAGAAVALVLGLVAWELIWKPRRRRAIERTHARNKLR